MPSLRKRKRSKRALYWIERRRRKRKVEKPNIIDDLPESLLLQEIFSKLCNPRDLVSCKNVSKRWNSLISSSSSSHHNPSLALVLNTQPHQYATNDICLEVWKGFDLSNYVDPEFDPPICVLASCKDVLLCMKSEELYIVNPVTMQWTRLPDPCGSTWGLPIGLIGNGTKGLYHVVNLFMSTHSYFRLFLFNSMLGTWKSVGVQHQPWSQSGWCPTQYQALAFKGALHWLAEDGPVVAYNPNDQNTCLLIHRSHDMSHASYGADAIVSETLTVSIGYLRILQLVASVDHQHLYIWTLVDYKRSIWRQEHEAISFTDFPWLQDCTYSGQNYKFMSCFVSHTETRKRILYPKPLCCHPYSPLLVYFCLPERIVSLDIATRQMKLITTLSKSSTQGVHWNEYDKVIPMTMHLDPSLIPDHGNVLQKRRKHRFFRV
ncbi:unnamed protein product [Eruca vesicaria subsp. sativa]|uniref:F-box domain-containing protein n=1 Tax=Eruca vesicaria subsp. sativa TaxID=29727 RepID=A0ABC8IZR3_ERUVS|nr:unnamed protein product [Eruca vesicaria subsp. sativa]